MFFAPVLQRHPDWLFSLLAEDLDRTLDDALLTRRLDAALVGSAGDEEAALRRFKYYELARITMRDCIPGRLALPDSGDTLRELSSLADVLLARSNQPRPPRTRPCREWQ